MVEGVKQGVCFLATFAFFSFAICYGTKMKQHRYVLYKIDSYFVSPDDPRNGPFKVPVDLKPVEKRWAGLVAESRRELDETPYDWGPSWPVHPSKSFWEKSKERTKHNIWPNPHYKSQLDKAVYSSLKKTMSDVDKELRPPNQLRQPVKNWMEG